jgi:CBS domain-containing protein
MKETTVRDLMVPLQEYATVSQDALLIDAVKALEKAQARFDQTRYRHRAVLVLDEDDRVVGKISQLGLLGALLPNYSERMKESGLKRFGLSEQLMEQTYEQGGTMNSPLDRLCFSARTLKVSGFMDTLAEGEFIEADESLSEALQDLVLGNHHSLLVTEGNRIVGVLRLTDVFTTVCRLMEECPGAEDE